MLPFKEIIRVQKMCAFNINNYWQKVPFNNENVLATEKKIKLVKIKQRCEISIEPLSLPNFQMLVMNCHNNDFYRTIYTVFELLNHRFSC